MRFVLPLLLLTSPLFAQDTTLVTPVFTQIIAIPLPEGFDLAFQDSSEEFHISEAVPTGQTVEGWSEMVTLTGFKGGAGDGIDALIPYAQNLANQYSLACPNSFTTYQYGLGKLGITGAKGTMAILMGCGEIEVAQGPSVSGAEAAVIIFALGTSELYTFQWAERFTPDQGKQSYDPAGIWRNRLAELLANARICDPVPGEEAPYPSCLK